MSLKIEPELLKIEITRYIYKITSYKGMMMTIISDESCGKN